MMDSSAFTIRLPPRINNYRENKKCPLALAAPPISIFSLSDPLSIAANQCRCPFTTKALSTSDDAVYNASFGTKLPQMTLSKKRFLKVSPLRFTEPIPLTKEFSLKLQECNSMDFNIAAISAFARDLVNSLDIHPQLNTGALLW
jgi:hypothetical protein